MKYFRMALSTRGKLAVRSEINIEQGFEPPLDFTFMCLTSVAGSYVIRML